MLPRVTIAIPAFNAKDTVAASVESALGQSYPECQVVVVDDGSEDGTANRVEAFGDRVLLIRKENGGLSSARDAAHDATDSPLIAWLDADDVAEPERIEVQVAALEHDPELMLVSTGFSAFDENGPRGERYANTIYGALAEGGGLPDIFGAPESFAAAGREWPLFKGSVAPTLALGNFIHPPTVLIRREAIDQVGRLDEGFGIGGDWLYFIRVARMGPIGYIDAPLLRYRISASQMTSVERHGARIARDNIRGMEEVRDRFPKMIAPRRALFERRLGSQYFALAEQLADDDGWEALLALRKGASLGASGPGQLKTAVKAILPRSISDAVRRIRG